MNKKICCIYKLTNKLNGKVYIGQTVDYYRRMNEYKNRKASKSKSSKYKIMEAIEKDGFENFESSIVKECKRNDLTYFEMFYIKKYDSYKDEFGYNSFHLNNNLSQTLSKSTKNKMSNSHKGLKESSETKRKKSNKIYAINDDTFIICDSGKLFGDYVGKSKDYIKNCLRQPSRVEGYRLFYVDKEKRDLMREKMLNKRSIRDKDYIKLLDYLDNSSVETIKSDYNVKYLTYDCE